MAVLLTPLAMAQCPIAATCTPGAATSASAPAAGLGIARVQLGTINSATGNFSEGYRDYSCTVGTDLTAGAPYTLTIVTSSTVFRENVRVWIDYDNNGIFNETSELYFSSNNATTHTGANLLVPATAVLNTKLRMRVAADRNNSPFPTPCSTPEYSQTEDYAVTVRANGSAPIAAFTVNDTLTCTGLVQFTDQSTNAPSAWRWNFGDNTTSTQQSPQHQYTAQGIYTVTLIVTNANGTDTLVRPRYVRYNNQVPVAAACTPQTISYCCNYGITRVQFAGINRTSATGSASYEDFTCSSRAAVVAGNTYTLTITTGGTSAHDVRAWLDANGDGQFTANELLLTALASTGVTASVTIPATAVGGPLRLRIIADAVGQVGGTACSPPQNGQAEDYTVVVQQNTLPPVAAFAIAPTGPCDLTKAFTDQSQNAPSSWLWYFGDGTTSTVQNPTHAYGQSGTFTVSLVVTNGFGRDSVAQVNAVFVTIPCRTYCVPTNLQTQSIWISQVQLAQINRSSGLDPGAYAVTYDSPARLTQGRSETLTVSTVIGGGMGQPFFTTTAWIDYDQNGTWDASERVMQLQGDPNNATLQQLITVPTAALVGPTMMRVITTRNNGLANNPCPPSGAPGIEVEDYLIVISGQQAAPEANFLTLDSLSCNGLVQFRDRSSNAPTGWRWTFGDGSPASTEQNPQHQYPTTRAVYTVKLRVVNAFGRDSITRTAIVRVTGDPVPVAPSCRPESSSPGFGLGIDSVSVRALNQQLANSSPNQADGYRDYSCGVRGVIYRGRPATLRVRTIQQMGARVVAWIDYDNDGTFNATTERVLISANTTGGVHQATFTVPTTVPLNVPIRLRVGSDWINNPTLVPCGGAGGLPQPQYGQMEDYTLVARDTVLAAPEARAPLALTVGPNPTFDGRVVVRLTGDVPGLSQSTTLTLTVRSVLGQVVARRSLVMRAGSETAVDLTDLARGVYVLQADSPVGALRGTIRLIRD